MNNTPDKVDEVAELLVKLALFRIRTRFRLTAEQDLKHLEERAGRELPAVRAQLELLLDPATAEIDFALPAALPEADPPAKRRGRKPKDTTLDTEADLG